MDATTTRASTVIRSMPTSETRTHASITMPLSSTRSRTSMRLVPPGARSTGGMGVGSPPSRSSGGWRWRDGRSGTRPAELALQLEDAGFQAGDRVLRGGRIARHQRSIVPPPVEADLFGLVDRAHQQADAHR